MKIFLKKLLLESWMTNDEFIKKSDRSDLARIADEKHGNLFRKYERDTGKEVPLETRKKLAHLSSNSANSELLKLKMG